jgi:hypothetical protein
MFSVICLSICLLSGIIGPPDPFLINPMPLLAAKHAANSSRRRQKQTSDHNAPWVSRPRRRRYLTLLTPHPYRHWVSHRWNKLTPEESAVLIIRSWWFHSKSLRSSGQRHSSSKYVSHPPSNGKRGSYKRKRHRIRWLGCYPHPISTHIAVR